MLKKRLYTGRTMAFAVGAFDAGSARLGGTSFAILLDRFTGKGVS